MDNSKRSGDDMGQNGPPNAKKSRSSVQNSYTNGFSHENSSNKCPVCLWPINSSKCYHTNDHQESTSRRLHWYWILLIKVYISIHTKTIFAKWK